MALFVLDVAGNTNLLEVDSHGTAAVQKRTQWRTLVESHDRVCLDDNESSNAEELPDENSENEKDVDYFGLPPPNVDISEIIRGELPKLTIPKTKLEEELEKVTEKIKEATSQITEKRKKFHKRINNTMDFSDYNPATGKFDIEQQLKTNIEKEMARSQIKPDFEKLKELPFITKKKQREIIRIEREKTKGRGWYNLPATEHTEETTNELKILQMRSVLDPKHFYKKNDLKVLPKYFQIGTVQHSPLDYYSERGTRHKKRSMVDDLLEDEAALNFTKRKFKEVQARREKYAHRKALQKMKKQKKKKS
ncbi:uncharacterized protein [Eurosta solidaginis]|uniref:uncharacterized protein n=1 Tax=Eurosta solidaginis TaxID=178769 RepID=UPI0035307E06